MSININKLIRAVRRNDLLVTPILEPWLIKHGDEALPDAVVDRLAAILRTKPRDRSRSFSGALAGACKRRQELAYAGVRGGAVDSQLQNIFNDGKYRHLRWQGYLLALGLISDIEYLVRWPKMYSRGSLDGRGVVPKNHPNDKLRGLTFGLEVKGVSTFQFSKYKSDYKMKGEHLSQIHHYFVLSDVDFFVVIYEDKTTQAFLEFVVFPDPNLLRQAEYEIRHLANAVNTKTLDPILPECRKRTGDIYKNCPYGLNGACALARHEPPPLFARS